MYWTCIRWIFYFILSRQWVRAYTENVFLRRGHLLKTFSAKYILLMWHLSKTKKTDVISPRKRQHKKKHRTDKSPSIYTHKFQWMTPINCIKMTLINDLWCISTALFLCAFLLLSLFLSLSIFYSFHSVLNKQWTQKSNKSKWQPTNYNYKQNNVINSSFKKRSLPFYPCVLNIWWMNEQKNKIK